jgi:D-lactate dehydrogenase
MPFGSKGYKKASTEAVTRLVEALWEWTDGGQLPVVVDTSPCTHTLRHCEPELDPALRERYEKLEILDGVEFARKHVVPHLEARRRPGTVALYPVCSMVRMGLDGQLSDVVEPFCSDSA